MSAAPLLRLVCAVTSALVCGVAPAARADMIAPDVWTQQASGTTEALYGVSCSSAETCMAVGQYGTVLQTSDGGHTWTQNYAAHAADWNSTYNTYPDLHAVSCASATHCYAVGDSSTILETDNAGQTWSRDASYSATIDQATILQGGYLWNLTTLTPISDNYRGISCPAVNACYVVGQYGNILSTFEGGAGAAPFFMDIGSIWPNGYGISCPSVTHCLAVGSKAQIEYADEGPLTQTGQPLTDFGIIYSWWSSQSSGLSSGDTLYGVSCANDAQCAAVGAGSEQGGPLTVTQDGGGASTGYVLGYQETVGGWSPESTGLTWNPTFTGISCPSASQCWAVGNGGVVASTTTDGVAVNGAPGWRTQQISTYPSLNAISCPTSEHCFAVGYSGVIYGYNGITDVSTAVQQEASCIESQLTGTPNPLAGDSILPGTGVCGDVGDVASDPACIQGQMSNPNPARGDDVCQTAGSAAIYAQLAAGLAQTVLADLEGVVGKGGQEAGCVQGQLSNPNPSASDPLGSGLCGDVGTAVGEERSLAGALGGVIAELEGVAGQGSQEAGCVEGQLSNPNPSASDPLGTGVCGDVGAGIDSAQQDPACVQSQLTNPNPSQGDALCQAVGTVLADAGNPVATVTGAVNRAQATVQTAESNGASEAGCLQGQLSNPSPSAGDPLGTGLCGDVGGLLSDPACVQSQLTNPNPSRGDALCQAVGTALGDAGPAVSTATGVVNQVLGIAQTTAGSANSEASCLQGQASNADPSAGDAFGTGACGDAGTAATSAQQDPGCLQGQVSRADASQGDALCQLVGAGLQTAQSTPCPNGQAGAADQCSAPPQASTSSCAAGELGGGYSASGAGAGYTCATPPDPQATLTGPIAGIQPLAPGQTDSITGIPQPNYSQAPVFGGYLTPQVDPAHSSNDPLSTSNDNMFQTDQHDSWPGATWAGPGPSPVAVTVGGGVVYIQYAAGGQYGQQHGIEMFDEKTLAYLGAFGTGGPNTNVGCPPCRVTYNRAGIAYYNGQVYASDPASDNIDVYDAQGNLKRSFPTMVGAPNGLGVAWGEVWVDLTTGNGGGSYDDTQNNNGGLPELGVYDAQTGALKAIVPIDAPCAAGDTEQLVENTDGCAPAGGNRGADGSPYNFWSPTFDFQDLAAAPELGGVFAQCHFVGRSAVLTQLSAVDEVDADHYGDCPTNGWLEGVQYVPGMSWLLASSGDPNVSYGMPGQYISEYSVGPGTAGTRLALRRRWQPMDAQANPGDNNNVMPAFRDAAYHYRGPQIDWSGNSTRPDWQHGNQCVRYIVSDADIFVAGWRGERWYDLARNFSSITFTLDGQTITTSTSPNGQVCFNEDSYSSGAHTLAASAVADGQTINISTSLHIDHTGPTGTINSQPQYVAHTITLSGNAVQPYSGLGTVTVQSSKDGTNWSTACSASVDHGDGNWTCQWDTTTVSDGAYQLRAAMSNNVQPAFGGATTGNSSTATTTIDNTPPVITNTAPDIYQAGYEMGGGDVTPVYLTALENLSGAASTTVFVNSATDGSSNGSWNSIGTVTGGGDQTIAWDSVSMPPGFYQLRAHSCNKAGACGDTYWQAEMASASCRPGQHKCPNQPCVSGAELGASGTFCYVAREAGNGDQWTSYGVSATITTPKNVPTQHNDAGGTFCDCAGDHTADYVNIGGGKYSNVWLQTGINTNCGIQSGSDDTWGDYAEYTSPQGMTYFQCFNPNGTGNPAGDGRTSPKGQVQSFKVVIGGGYHARADINGHPVMIQYEVPPTYGTCPDTDNDGDTQYDADNDGDSGTLSYCYVGRKFGKRAYLLEKQGLVNTDASGEINQVNGDNCRVLGGTFSNWQIAYRQGSFVSPSNPYTYSDTGYRWGSLTNTSWNVWGPDNC